MPLRIVGAASIILSICIVALDFNQMAMAKELAGAMISDGHAWNLPVSQEVFLARSRLWGDVVIVAGALTAFGGLGMAFRRHWGMFVAAAAADKSCTELAGCSQTMQEDHLWGPCRIQTRTQNED